MENDMESEACPVAEVLEMLSRKHMLRILKALEDNGKLRFNEFLRAMDNNISPRTLSKRLKELEESGIISKKIFPEIPPRVEYSLTEKGKELITCFNYLDSWIKKYG